MNISNHIGFYEAIRSSTADRKGIENTPSSFIIERMKITAVNIFEPVREHFGVPIRINSFYRSTKLNKAVGGAPWSQHCRGEAIDIDDSLGRVTNFEMFEFVKFNLNFDQLIWEFGDSHNPAWLHVSYVSRSKNRNQILKAQSNKVTKRTIYVPFQ